MSRHGAPSGLAWQVGDVYTLHLWPPFGVPGVQQSGHYTGWALEGRLAYRLTDHAMRRGARLTQLQLQAGGSWVLAGVEHGVTRDREHQLKYRGASRRCQVCRAQRDLEAGKITPEQAPGPVRVGPGPRVPARSAAGDLRARRSPGEPGGPAARPARAQAVRPGPRAGRAERGGPGRDGRPD